MDPALLRQREQFLQRARALPSVEAKPKKDESGASSSEPSTSRYKSVLPPSTGFSKPSASGSSGVSGALFAYRCSVLSKIVKHLKSKFQEGEDSPLALDEILDETNQLDVNDKNKIWLLHEAFPNNPKIEQTEDGKFVFKPPLKCRDKKSLLRLLKLHDMKGLGGIYRDDVVESIPQAERVLKALDSDIITVTRPDKKKILFYYDKQSRPHVDEEFIKLWRGVAVDGIDDQKIEDYLDKAGIRSMEGQGVKRPLAKMMKKSSKRKTIKKLKDNEHLAGELKHYE